MNENENNTLKLERLPVRLVLLAESCSPFVLRPDWLTRRIFSGPIWSRSCSGSALRSAAWRC